MAKKARRSSKPRAPLPAWVVNFALLFAVLAIGLGGIEVYLRLRGPLHDLYAYHPTNPPLHEKYNMYLFPTTYRGQAWFQKEFLTKTKGPIQQTKTRPMSKFDPQLGWDLDQAADRMRGRIYPRPRTPGVGRIQFLGDSFTHGTDVEAHESYPYYAGQLLQVESLNMGVGGYAIDQPYLKYLYHGAAYNPDVVVFGIMVSDYQRTSASFTAFSKPLIVFNPTSREFVITNQPVPNPEVMYRELAGTIKTKPRLFAAIESAYWNVREKSEEWTEQFLADTDLIVKHVISDMKTKTRENKAALLIVDIPPSTAFSNPVWYDANLEGKYQQHLAKIYREVDVPVIDIRSEFLRQHSAEHIVANFYLPDPGGRGHMTARGNEAVARLIAEVLCRRRPPEVIHDLRPQCDRL